MDEGPPASAGSLVTAPAARRNNLLTGLLIPFCFENLIAERNVLCARRSDFPCRMCDFLLVSDGCCDLSSCRSDWLGQCVA